MFLSPLLTISQSLDFDGNQRRKPLPPLVRYLTTTGAIIPRRRGSRCHHHRSSLYTAVSHDPSEVSSSQQSQAPTMGVSAGDSTLGVVIAAAQRSRPVVPRRGGR
ncbi:hypothetical protein F2Q69_00055427 [Brassica cretica]|uniref:Uncharacterized protein n=1 Tax=Brassica cretica TaxID=69181 RepID=A0A8S9MWP5_BRACR|nr:hypothetical protein F2Q69_00055427 [Brassica cretica]